MFFLAKGHNAAYIQEKLYISEGTAKTHIRHVYKKTNVHSQQELMRLVELADPAVIVGFKYAISSFSYKGLGFRSRRGESIWAPLILTPSVRGFLPKVVAISALPRLT